MKYLLFSLLSFSQNRFPPPPHFVGSPLLYLRRHMRSSILKEDPR
ncbi:hypothetical protein ES332_A12G076800v1 [Gossypium tomentosum]|uniref:Uncharacterized protein n=1 Tax=Gossypium tomentosum TaxID=34277 RepID=A0A5D2MTQ3_GOSTO|nr:hypothetical protein ES332_A12G076800v1 [Gossypium tomentosum]